MRPTPHLGSYKQLCNLKLVFPSLARILLIGSILLPVVASADEIDGENFREGFFLFSEQDGRWDEGQPAEAWTSLRLGYGQEQSQFSWAAEAGARIITGFDVEQRTDWSAKLEAAWVPEGSKLEFYGEYEPALSTENGNEGFYQAAKAGLVIPLLESGSPRFDLLQGFADASGIYLKLEQDGEWAVGGHQEQIQASPRLGYGFEAGQMTMAFEIGPGFAWSDSTTPQTNLLGKVDFSINPSEHWELFMEYEPTYIFVNTSQGLEHVLKGGVVFSF